MADRRLPHPHRLRCTQLQGRAPNSAQLVGFLTLLVSDAILLLLSGLTVTATVLGVIFFIPSSSSSVPYGLCEII
ncbi:hypothetical protein PS2_036745 [Malus domestica]